MFNNPLSYAGYPPGVTGKATNTNTTVRAATATEAATGTLTDAYISPATAQSATALDFASPPVLGFGSTTPRPVHATTLDSTLNTALATSAAVTTVDIANVAAAGARTTNINGGTQTQNDTLRLMVGAHSAGTQSLNLLTGVHTGGTQTINILTGNSSGGTQALNLLTGTRASTVNLATGAAAHTINMLGSSGLLGFFGASAVVKQTQGALTNSVTAGGVTGTIANYTDLTVYANDAAAIRNDIYQLSLALSGVITALRNYGLLV